MSQPALPIDEVLPVLLSSLQQQTQVILKAPPGAGKSTRFPQHLMAQFSPENRIILLEPRRLAARNIARFLSSQLGEKVGETVGLRVRGETLTSAKTKLEVVTEGVLTRMVQSEPELDGVGCIIFDEFHERSLHADTALALCLDVQAALREDLRLVVMSATLDDSALRALMPEAVYVVSEGRSFPVEMRYQPIESGVNPNAAIANAVCALLSSETGSMLVFLPGVGEIKQLHERLMDCVSDDVDICPLYGQLEATAQQAAIMPASRGRRKVVLATNIAETSLTIEGVRLVVDSGLERTSHWDPKAALNRLDVSRIAQSSAEQRAGRAGRLEAGICVRLYSESSLQSQPPQPIPEILRSDLTPLAMELLQWGCVNGESLHWLDAPPRGNLSQAQAWLQWAGISKDNGQLSTLGQKVVTVGGEPRHGLMMVYAQQWGDAAMRCAAYLLALLETPLRGQTGADLVRQIVQLADKPQGHRRHWQRAKQWAGKMGIQLGREIESQWVGLLLAAGYPDRIGQSRGQGGRFALSGGQGAVVDESDPLALHGAIVVADMMRTRQGDAKVFSGAEIDLTLVAERLPHLIIEREWCDWDDKRGKLIAEKQTCCGKLVISKKALPSPTAEQSSLAILHAIQRKGLASLPWDKRTECLVRRARYAAQLQSAQAINLAIALPDLSDNALLAAADMWLLPFLQGVTQWQAVQSIDLYSALEAHLGWDTVKSLNQLLPTHYAVPTGSNVRLRYSETSAPVLSVRMQEMYGEAATPMIADGQIALVVELLSPAQRPLQVTQDLAAFWRGSYKDVQKEMKGRYPKHIWPDDPATHVATTKTKRHFSSK
ncbi:ATP-dependent helicase HrpB [Thaumasiovibrio subtropicus]|uniref:ATP-dependent helicase HrpB n=1 Tax=Thaumasiovibrio subtropicus TaxID=1891207 RepID=UPI000B35A779|nr:ATP-dependent helicase HrpB [Thaumasiovibrio subtropicus]